MASLCDYLCLIVGRHSSLQAGVLGVLTGFGAKQLQYFETAENNTGEPRWLIFSVGRKKRHVRNITTGDALDETRRNAHKIAFFTMFSLNRSSFSGAILYPKTAHMSHR